MVHPYFSHKLQSMLYFKNNYLNSSSCHSKPPCFYFSAKTQRRYFEKWALDKNFKWGNIVYVWVIFTKTCNIARKPRENILWCFCCKFSLTFLVIIHCHCIVQPQHCLFLSFAKQLSSFKFRTTKPWLNFHFMWNFPLNNEASCRLKHCWPQKLFL